MWVDAVFPKLLRFLFLSKIQDRAKEIFQTYNQVWVFNLSLNDHDSIIWVGRQGIRQVCTYSACEIESSKRELKIGIRKMSKWVTVVNWDNNIRSLQTKCRPHDLKGRIWEKEHYYFFSQQMCISDKLWKSGKQQDLNPVQKFTVWEECWYVNKNYTCS